MLQKPMIFILKTIGTFMGNTAYFGRFNFKNIRDLRKNFQIDLYFSVFDIRISFLRNSHFESHIFLGKIPAPSYFPDVLTANFHCIAFSSFRYTLEAYLLDLHKVSEYLCQNIITLHDIYFI